jgi:hypothetical protein
MKTFFSFGLLILILSCCNTKKKDKTPAEQVTKEYKIMSDTFNLRNLYKDTTVLQKDIQLDTIEIPQNKKHLDISIIYPKLSPKELPDIYKRVNQLIETRKSEFYELVKDEEVEYDTSLSYPLGWDMWIRPVLLYKNAKVISFAIETGSGYSGMPSGFDYRVINFDLERKKEIAIGDYFKLITIADSTYLGNIIKQAIGQMNIDAEKYLGEIIFAFDDHSVYFFFDKYHPWGWGIFSVEKKYIIDHINPFYR